MIVNPRLLFLYWVVDEVLERALHGARGPGAILLERVSGSGTPGVFARAPIDYRAGSWYLPAQGATGTVRALLGLEEAGGFRELLRTEPIAMPRTSPGSDPEVWMDVRALRAGRGEPVEPPPHRYRVVATEAGTDGPEGGGTAWRSRGISSSPVRAVWSHGPADDAAGAAARGERLEAIEGPWPPRKPAKAGVPPLGIRDPRGYLCFVLHAHLPYVRHPEKEFYLEEQWLFEAITETYLPILDFLDHMARDRVPARITISVSPTLATMLRDPVLIGKYERRLGQLCELAAREVERTRKDASFSPPAGFYWDRLHRLQHLFAETYGRDLLAQFARLEDEGVVELITSAATHGMLPHHRLDLGTLRAQVKTGVEEHRRVLGRSPRGLWLPECAYFEGLDALLADAGLEYFFVDAHAVRNASSPPRFDVHAPIVCPTGVAAFGRDEESSVQVWSSEQGYPGDPSYRDFYRDIGFDLDERYVRPYLDPAGARGMTGFKYHRITGRTDHKEPYRRDQALQTAWRHAQDFVRNRRLQIDWLRGGMDRPPLIVSMYDAELFGHWWFEGPDWLELALRGLPGAGIAVISPAQYLREHAVAQVATPSTSSWGEGGYFDVWLSGANDWILPPLHAAGRSMAALAQRFAGKDGTVRRALAQAGRELLLAQASDWPFILRNQTTPEYARQRVHEHLDRFERLKRMLESGRVEEPVVRELETKDAIFPDVDPRLWSRP